MKRKCEDCQHWRGKEGTEYGYCPEMGALLVGDFVMDCGYFWEKENDAEKV